MIGSAFIGYVYPAYSTFKALRAKNSKGLQRLLVLWTVLGFVHTTQLLTDTFVYW